MLLIEPYRVEAAAPADHFHQFRRAELAQGEDRQDTVARQQRFQFRPTSRPPMALCLSWNLIVAIYRGYCGKVEKPAV